MMGITHITENEIQDQLYWKVASMTKNKFEEHALGQLPKTEVKYVSPDMGHGLFTDQPLSTDQFVGEYTGIVRRLRHRHDKNNKYLMYLIPGELEGGDSFPRTKSPLVIDASYKGCETRFMNHSDAPNVTITTVYSRGHIKKIFTATRDIKRGEELRFNYHCSEKMFT
jgi:SET domain-containing protein